MSALRLIVGDCREVMGSLAENSVDAVVTDPPYHLTTGKKGGTGAKSLNPNSPAARSRIGTGFMGKSWDGGDVAFRPETWAAALRVAKPGAYLAAFGGTRTYHRLTCAIEDAGWEIRDSISLLNDLSPIIAAIAAELQPGLREQFYALLDQLSGDGVLSWLYGSGFPKSHNGPWGGTALKPAWEPIILARKPLDGTVKANHALHGTGALNIDDCRIATDDRLDGGKAPPLSFNGTNARPFHEKSHQRRYTDQGSSNFAATPGPRGGDVRGRWPANVVLDEESGELLDGQSGELTSGAWNGERNGPRNNQVFGVDNRHITEDPRERSVGGASRFFYTAKASRSERDAGLSAGENNHPTVKPLSLMQWLCRLVTPKGGTILDPFCGSGSTGVAASREGFGFVAIELIEEHASIARGRIAAEAGLFADPDSHLEGVR